MVNTQFLAFDRCMCTLNSISTFMLFVCVQNLIQHRLFAVGKPTNWFVLSVCRWPNVWRLNERKTSKLGVINCSLFICIVFNGLLWLLLNAFSDVVANDCCALSSLALVLVALFNMYFLYCTSFYCVLRYFIYDFIASHYYIPNILPTKKCRCFLK